VIIDAILAFVGFGTVIALVSGQAQASNGSYGFHLHGLAAFALLVVMFGYWIVCERVWGTTIGKRLFSIRVVGADGGRIGVGQSVGRNLLRVVDGFPYVLPYLVGFVASRTNGERLRLGDMAAGTRVVARPHDPA
jgi:uncharacterized RDD family membrane protein YckC